MLLPRFTIGAALAVPLLIATGDAEAGFRSRSRGCQVVSTCLAPVICCDTVAPAPVPAQGPKRTVQLKRFSTVKDKNGKMRVVEETQLLEVTDLPGSTEEQLRQLQQQLGQIQAQRTTDLNNQQVIDSTQNSAIENKQDKPPAP